MAYVVHPVLGEMRSEILERLLRGELTRTGGVLRVSKGMKGAGSIAAHLRDVGQAAQQVAPALANALQLTQVAAAASVVGLGVSVIGFALMAHKLNKLQASIAELTAVASRNHTEVMAAMARVEQNLVELKLIGLESQELIHAAIAEVRAVRRDLLDGYMARVSTEVDLLQRLERVEDAQARPALRTFGETRRWVRATMDSLPAPAVDDVHWLDRMLRYRVISMTWVAEVQLLRRIGDPAGAATLARDAADTSRAWARSWGDVLLPPEELGGAFRFAHRQLAEVPRETYRRLVLRETGDLPGLGDPRELSASASVAQALPRLGSDWFAKQRAIAPMVDLLEEATSRFESLADEMEICRRERLDWSRWECLPAPTGTGLAIITAEA